MADGLVGTDLRIGDVVVLQSGGPDMTVIGHNDSDIRCGFFVSDSDGRYSEFAIVSLPRAALRTPST